jgi:hypothetical protein
MFGMALKNIPAKYAFAGYSVRKGLSVMMTNMNGKMVYDIFIYSYVDNYLSFYTLMESGKYRNVSTGEEVPEATAEDIMSKHLYRGPNKDASAYGTYDKDKIVGVFGVRNIETLMKETDEIAKKDDTKDVSLQAFLDVKNQYMGMEIMGVINRFNGYLKWEKDTITVPAIKYGLDDEFNSVIGDEMDFFDFMSNKDSDQIIREINILKDSTDGIGNVKKGMEIKINKAEDEKSASTLEVIDKTKNDL